MEMLGLLKSSEQKRKERQREAASARSLMSDVDTLVGEYAREYGDEANADVVNTWDSFKADYNQWDYLNNLGVYDQPKPDQESQARELSKHLKMPGIPGVAQPQFPLPPKEEDLEPGTMGQPLRRGAQNALKIGSGLVRATPATLALLANDPSGVKGNDIMNALQPTMSGYADRMDAWIEKTIPAEEPTGRLARPAESLEDLYKDPARTYMLVAENGPQMLAFIAASMVNPALGVVTMYGAEAGDAVKAMDVYEKTTGETLDPQLRMGTTVLVGGINAALEHVGISAVLNKIPGLRGKMAKFIFAALTEGSTEGLQEIVQILAENGYNKEAASLSEDYMRVAESAYIGMILGAAGGSGTAIYDSKEQARREKLIMKMIDDYYAEAEKEHDPADEQPATVPGEEIPPTEGPAPEPETIPVAPQEPIPPSGEPVPTMGGIVPTEGIEQGAEVTAPPEVEPAPNVRQEFGDDEKADALRSLIDGYYNNPTVLRPDEAIMNSGIGNMLTESQIVALWDFLKNTRTPLNEYDLQDMFHYDQAAFQQYQEEIESIVELAIRHVLGIEKEQTGAGPEITGMPQPPPPGEAPGVGLLPEPQEPVPPEQAAAPAPTQEGPPAEQPPMWTEPQEPAPTESAPVPGTLPVEPEQTPATTVAPPPKFKKTKTGVTLIGWIRARGGINPAHLREHGISPKENKAIYKRLARANGLGLDDLAQSAIAEGIIPEPPSNMNPGEWLLQNLLEGIKPLSASAIKKQEQERGDAAEEYVRDKAEDLFPDIKVVPLKTAAAAELEEGTVVEYDGDVYVINEQTGEGAKLVDGKRVTVDPWESLTMLGVTEMNRPKEPPADVTPEPEAPQPEVEAPTWEPPGNPRKHLADKWNESLEHSELRRKSQTPGGILRATALEAGGDIIREFGEHEDKWIDRAYINERMKRIEACIKNEDWHNLDEKDILEYIPQIQKSIKALPHPDEQTEKLVALVDAIANGDEDLIVRFMVEVEDILANTPNVTSTTRTEKTEAGEQITPTELRPQAQIPPGKIGQESDKIEGVGGVGMFGTEEKPAEQEEMFGEPKAPEAAKKPAEAEKIDPFEYQNENQEKIIHMDWSANSFRFILEGAGDIFRELAKKDQEKAYINEKLKRIRRFVQLTMSKEIHYEDSYKWAVDSNDHPRIVELIELWRKQPVETPEQALARDLNLHLLQGQSQGAADILDKLDTLQYADGGRLLKLPSKRVATNLAGLKAGGRGAILGTTEEIEKQETADAERMRKMDVLVKVIKKELDQGYKYDFNRLKKHAEDIFDAKVTDGVYTVQDLYEAQEVAINIIVADKQKLNPHSNFIETQTAEYRRLAEQSATQTFRTAEKEARQQFSTPPELGAVVAHLANINENDVVLEPSAGVGGLAAFAANAAKVHVNELDPRRSALLDKFLGEKGITEKATQHNAEFIDDLLPENVKPTVVLMNPPFSNSAKDLKDTKYGFKHLNSALRRLQDGGRLVAILGESGGFDRAKSLEEWKKIFNKYNVRAVITTPKKVYDKYGTTFGSIVVVIDKIGPTPGSTFVEQLKSVEKIEDAESFGGIRNELNEIRKTRPEPKRGDVEPVGTGVLPGGGKPGGDTGGRSDIPRVPKPGQRGDGTGESQGQKPGDESVPGSKPGAKTEPATRPAGLQPGPGSPEDVGPLKLETGAFDEMRTEEQGGKFVSYKPQKLTHGKEHMGDIVESASMAAVSPPDITYEPSLPKKIIDSGAVSALQLEAIVYIGQSHSKFTKDGRRLSYLEGDGTGVGKTRVLAGVILDNWNKGRKRTIYVSYSRSLYKDLTEEMNAIDAGNIPITVLNDMTASEQIPDTDGVVYLTYNTLIAKDKKGNSRLDQLVQWAGDDAIVILDESHRAKNAMASERGKGSQTGQAVLDLTEVHLPKARVVYSSATGATDVRHMCYMARLGLWGEGTTFTNFVDFMQRIENGGLGVMEVVSRELKALGRACSRTLSFKGVEYEEQTHVLTGSQRKQHDLAAKTWQTIHNYMAEAYEVTSANAQAKMASERMFWGNHLRFMGQMIMAFKVPTLIKETDKQLAAGNSVVIGLIGTGESRVDRAIAKARAEGIELEDIDTTPRELLVNYITEYFPVGQFQEEYDPLTGRNRTVPVLDSNGVQVQSQEALRLRDELIARLTDLDFGENPLDQIINHYGVDAVAEMTGRKTRMIRTAAGKYEHVKRKIEGVAGDKINNHERDLFQSGKKRIAIISQAASTGISLHADKNNKNQQRRVHITLELSWSADQQMQTFGRTHRTNQESAPKYILLSSDVGGEKRFSATIARRLASLGALTRGQQDAAGAGTIANYNFETPEGESALLTIFNHVKGHKEIPGIDEPIETFLEMGLFKKDTDGKITYSQSICQDVPKFFNRIMFLDIERQNALFDFFMVNFEAQVARAKEEGLFDEGVSDIKNISNVKHVENTVVRTDENGIATSIDHLTADEKIKLNTWGDALKYFNYHKDRSRIAGFFRHNKNRNIVLVWPRAPKADAATGEIKVSLNAYKPAGANGTIESEIALRKNYREQPLEYAQQLWNEEVEKAPKTKKTDIYLVTGLLLPYWKKLLTVLSDGSVRMKIVRVTADSGKRFVGIMVQGERKTMALRVLGVNNKYKTTSEMYDAIWEAGEVIGIDGPHVIKKSRIHGEEIVEIQGVEYKHDRLFTEWGCLSEKINWKNRYWLPTEKENAVRVLDKILAQFPVSTAEETEGDISHADRGPGTRRASFSPEDVSRANRTSRTAGAVGEKAITPKYVAQSSNKTEKILDFGAGRHAAHAAKLRSMGFDVTAHEFGDNVREGVHEPNALNANYDTVYASNVLNVQASEKMLRETLAQIKGATAPGGRALFNYPADPRISGMPAAAVADIIGDVFGAMPQRVGGTPSAPLWEVRPTKRGRIKYINRRDDRPPKSDYGAHGYKETPFEDDIPDDYTEDTNTHNNTGDYKAAARPSILKMPEIVELAFRLLGGDHPSILKRMKARGMFRVNAGGTKIELNFEIFRGRPIASVEGKLSDDQKIDMIKEVAQELNVPDEQINVHAVWNRKTGWITTFYLLDPELAARTLAHEIGHLVDFLDDMDMRRGNILGHMAGLKVYLKHWIAGLPQGNQPLTQDEKNELMKRARKELKAENYGRPVTDKARLKARYKKLFDEETSRRKLISRDVVLGELKNLTVKWRPFVPEADTKYTEYRYQNEELYADAFSALLNDPGYLEKIAPNFYRGFFGYLENKPEVKAVYDEIQRRIKAGDDEVFEHRHERFVNDVKAGNRKRLEKMNRKKQDSLTADLRKKLIDKNTPLIMKVEEARRKGAKIEPSQNPLYWVEELPYVQSEVFQYLRTLDQTVKKSLDDAGISMEDFSYYLFLNRVIGDRKYYANPQGYNETEGQADIPRFLKKIGPEKAKEIEQIRQKFIDARYDFVNQKLINSGMFSEEMAQLFADNAQYVTFSVQKYIDSEYAGTGIGAKIYQQFGTLRAIEDPFYATVMKDMALLRAVARNNAAKRFADFMAKEFADEIKEIPRGERGVLLWDHPPLGYKALLFTSFGRLQGFFVDASLADCFDSDYAEMTKFQEVWTSIMNPFRQIFVGHNPAWSLWNLQRDVWGTLTKLPDIAKTKKMLVHMAGSVGDAWKDVFHNVSTEVVEEMYRNKSLIVGRYYGRKLEQADSVWERMMMNWALDGKMPKSIGAKMLQFASTALETPGKFTERWVKIAGYKMLKEEGITGKELAHKTRTRVGSPDFYRRGSAFNFYNNLFLFSNAGKEGARSSFEAAQENKSAFAYKMFKYNVMPKMIAWSVRSGAFLAVVAALTDDDDDFLLWAKQLTKWMKMIPDHDMTNYMCVPLGEDANGKAVYLTMPNDFTGQIAAGITYRVLDGLRGGMDLTSLFDYVSGEMPYSSLSPPIQMAVSALQYASGMNPYDNWMGRGMIDDVSYRAGGKDSFLAFMKQSWNRYGGSYIFRFPYDDLDKIKSSVEKLTSLPVLGGVMRRIVRVSDRGLYEEDLKSYREDEKLRYREIIKINRAIVDHLNNTNEIGKADARRLYDELKKSGIDVKRFPDFHRRYNNKALQMQNTAGSSAIRAARTNAQKAGALSRQLGVEITAEQIKDALKLIEIRNGIKQGTAAPEDYYRAVAIEKRLKIREQ